MKSFLIFLFVICTSPVFGQHHFKGVVKDSQSKEPLIGATAVVAGMPETGTSADANGVIEIQDIPAGEQVVIFSYVGYESIERPFSFPLPFRGAH